MGEPVLVVCLLTEGDGLGFLIILFLEGFGVRDWLLDLEILGKSSDFTLVHSCLMFLFGMSNWYLNSFFYFLLSEALRSFEFDCLRKVGILSMFYSS